MTLRKFIFGIVLCYAALIAIVWLWPNPVRAAECPTTLDTVIATIESQGGAMLDLVDVADAEGFDQMLLARIGKEAIVFGLVSKGCVVSAPRQIGAARKLTPA